MPGDLRTNRRAPDFKPCPFCGKDTPIVEEHPSHTRNLVTWLPDHPGSWTVERPECPAVMIVPAKEENRAIWNRRPVDVRLAGRAPDRRRRGAE